MQYADQLTVPANHAGVPGISLPAGFDSAGLPTGIQLLGPDFSEATLLQIGPRLRDRPLRRCLEAGESQRF